MADRKRMAAALAAAALGWWAAPAAAHVVLDVSEAPADAFVRVALRVGHGCGGGAGTTAIRLEVPPGLLGVRPAPKPGWTIAFVPEGRDEGSPPREIVWRGGPLDDRFFDDFPLVFRTPDRPGETLYFPVVQECEGGAVSRWTERPEPGRPAPQRPAHPLRLVPKS